jgi:long-subunit fatty acid transport protein
MKAKLVILFIFYIIFLNLIAGVNFTNLSGSDLALGVGSRQISLGGAATLLDDAPGSVFWNPAGISLTQHSQLQIDFQSFTDFKNAIFVWKPKFLKPNNRQITIGISAVNRLRFVGSSQNVWTGYAAHLLDLTMLDLDDFKGDVDSNTFDFRLNATYDISSKLSFGATFVRLV